MKLLLPIIIIAILVGGYFGLQQLTKQKPIPITQISSPSPTSQELKTFQSKILKFTIQIPMNFNVKDEGSRVTITTPTGNIYISRNGTQFKSLKDFLEDLDVKNKITPVDQEKYMVRDYSAMTRVIKFPGGKPEGERLEYIYVDNAVYIFKAEKKELYETNYQIVQSFKYSP